MFILFIVISMTSGMFAGETLQILKAGGRTYSHVTVTEVTATDVFFISDQGMANVKLKDLDPALLSHFHYNSATAAAAERELRSGRSPYHFRVSGTNQPSSTADYKVELNDAIKCVKAIVNQPVTGLPRTPDMRVAICSPGWFHPGAERPDFEKVDIRSTQQLDYDKDEYVASDLDPDTVYIGHELEFNPMTKFFYTDRSVPKKKLTEAEMLEINRLYRIIGQDEKHLLAQR